MRRFCFGRVIGVGITVGFGFLDGAVGLCNLEELSVEWQTTPLPLHERLDPMKLPRDLERDLEAAAIQAALSRNKRPLWEGGSLDVLWLDNPEGVLQALSKLDFRLLERGLEHVSKVLERERRGLTIARLREGSPPPERISRLVLLSCDGSERFYRGAESLLLSHSDRCLGIRLNASAEELAASVGMEGKLIRLLLVADRGAVSRVLLSLVRSGKAAPAKS